MAFSSSSQPAPARRRCWHCAAAAPHPDATRAAPETAGLSPPPVFGPMKVSVLLLSGGCPSILPLPERLRFCFQEGLCWGTKWFCVSPLTYTALRRGWSVSIVHVVRLATHPVSQQQTKGWFCSPGPSGVSLSASTQLILLPARGGASGAVSPLVCSLPWVGQLPSLSETRMDNFTSKILCRMAGPLSRGVSEWGLSGFKAVRGSFGPAHTCSLTFPACR